MCVCLCESVCCVCPSCCVMACLGIRKGAADMEGLGRSCLCPLPHTGIHSLCMAAVGGLWGLPLPSPLLQPASELSFPLAAALSLPGAPLSLSLPGSAMVPRTLSCLSGSKVTMATNCSSKQQRLTPSTSEFPSATGPWRVVWDLGASTCQPALLKEPPHGHVPRTPTALVTARPACLALSAHLSALPDPRGQESASLPL